MDVTARSVAQNAPQLASRAVALWLCRRKFDSHCLQALGIKEGAQNRLRPKGFALFACAQPKAKRVGRELHKLKIVELRALLEHSRQDERQQPDAASLLIVYYQQIIAATLNTQCGQRIATLAGLSPHGDRIAEVVANERLRPVGKIGK